jgi:hypothetical protein
MRRSRQLQQNGQSPVVSPRESSRELCLRSYSISPSSVSCAGGAQSRSHRKMMPLLALDARTRLPLERGNDVTRKGDCWYPLAEESEKDSAVER